MGFSKKSMPKDTDLSLFVDYDHICLTLPEYTELLKSQMMLESIKQIYLQFQSYEYDRILAAFFGPKPKPEPKSEPEPKDGDGDA